MDLSANWYFKVDDVNELETFFQLVYSPIDYLKIIIRELFPKGKYPVNYLKSST